MTTSPLDREIRERIESFIGDVSTLVKRFALEAVQSVLGDAGSAPKLKRGPGRPPKAGSASPLVAAKRKAGGKRGRRAGEDIEKASEMMLAAIKSKPGLRLEELGKVLGVSTKGLKLPASKLIASGEVRTQGEKRGRKYFPGRARKK